MHRGTDVLHGFVKIYREVLGRSGHGGAPREILGKFHIYVADSLEQALREAIPYLRNYSAIHAAVDLIAN
jgi:hypothetical protein